METIIARCIAVPIVMLAIRTLIPLAILPDVRPTTYNRLTVDYTVLLMSVPFILQKLIDMLLYKDQYDMAWLPIMIRNEHSFVYMFIYLVSIVLSNWDSMYPAMATIIVFIGTMYYWTNTPILHDFLIPFVVVTGIVRSFLSIVTSPFTWNIRMCRFVQCVQALEIPAFVYWLYYYYTHLAPKNERHILAWDRILVLMVYPYFYYGSLRSHSHIYLLDRSIPSVNDVLKVTYLPTAVIADAHRLAIQNLPTMPQLEDGNKEQ